MTESAPHFTDDQAFNAFQRDLKKHYPPQCTDALGNTCNVVIGRVLDLTDSVDLGDITESQATEAAQAEGNRLGSNCTYGLSEGGRCGLGILCVLGPRD
jgi:hypothetical protein